MWATVSNGCGNISPVEAGAANSVNIQGLPFSRAGNTDRYAQFDLDLPKQWNEGTITYQVNWTALNSGTGNIVWGLQGCAVGDGGAIAQTYGTLVTVQDVFISAKTEHLTIESGALTVNGAAEGKRSIFRLMRQGSNTSSDTLSQDVILLGVSLYWTNDAAVDN